MSALLAGLRTGAWLDRQQFPPLNFAVPGIVPEGLSLLVGAPKIGKSWMVLSHALACASGGVTLGTLRVGYARPVLYLALEDGDRRMQQRCRVLLGSDPIPDRFEYLTRVEPGQLLATVTAWLELHPGLAPLVILDTLGKVMPPSLPGESSYQRDYRVGASLAALCAERPGVALLVNHHDRKAGAEDFVDSVSATHGLAGAADAVTALTRDRGGADGLLKVTGRDVAEAEYALEFREGSCWRLAADSLAGAATLATAMRATAGLGDRSADVVGFVLAHPGGVTPTDVAAALALEPRAVRVYLGRLVEAGRIARPARGLYTPVASVTSVASGGGAVLPLGNTRNASNAPTGKGP